DMDVVGNTVYLAAWEGGRRIYDVSNAASPVEIGTLVTGRRSQAVEVNGHYAYLAEGDADNSGTGALRVIDVSNPLSPTLVTTISLPNWALQVAIDGQVLYVATERGGLRTYSLANPANPTFLDVYPDVVDAKGVAISNG